MTGRDRSDKQDAMLDGLLNRVPAPVMPEGFAARIVRDVTRLPQDAIPPKAVTAPVFRPALRRWPVWAGGGAGIALAASLATMLVIPHGAEKRSAPLIHEKTSVADGQPTPAAEIASVANEGPASVATGPASPARLAESATVASRSPATPSQPSANVEGTAPLQLPVLVTRDAATPSPVAEHPASQTAGVEADDEAELVDGGTAVTEIPGSTSRSPGIAMPAPRGLGFAPGTTTGPPTLPSADEDEGLHRRHGPGRF